MKKTSESYYISNKKYSKFLDSNNPENFLKYVSKILSLSNKKSMILEAGCGVGQAIKVVQKKRPLSFGVEISKTSLSLAKKNGVNNCIQYDGNLLPFNEKVFDVVCSFNVLEHTNDPIHYLDEQLRVLKNGGYIVIVCPNFLSITNNYHKHTRGAIRKILNIIQIIIFLLTKFSKFKKMEPTNRDIFKPDDDAVNVTNPISLINWAKSSNISLTYWSSQQQVESAANKFDIGLFKLFFGSCFFIFQK